MQLHESFECFMQPAPRKSFPGIVYDKGQGREVGRAVQESSPRSPANGPGSRRRLFPGGGLAIVCFETNYITQDIYSRFWRLKGFVQIVACVFGKSHLHSVHLFGLLVAARLPSALQPQALNNITLAAS